MNKDEMKKLALLGLAAGALMGTLSSPEVMADENTIDLQYVLAKPKCKAHGGCGGLTASRELNSSAEDNDEDDDEDDDEDEDEDKKGHDNRKPSTSSKPPKPKALA